VNWKELAMCADVIVVGVDGSTGSVNALSWALKEGSKWECPVQIVTACPTLDVTAEGAGEMERHASEMQRHVLEHVLRDIESPPVITREVVRGDASDVLTGMSATARLLVVGSHGTYGLRHAGLGSVTDVCLRLSECPAVVVPAAVAGPGHSELIAPGERGVAPA
jgi:nucleotide-binding universal stress UspA family protein